MALPELLMRLDMCKAEPVEYSVERQLTLWDCRDRVEAKTFSFYVTLRHFSGEFMGKHVGLQDGDIAKFERGEEHTYRLPSGAGGEHMSVYVYNPAVCENGSLNFNISTTDVEGAGATQVCVEADNCQAVCKFGSQSMQTGHVTRLVSRDDNYLVEVRIEFGGRGVAE